jgi:hypothetical protein
MGEHAGRLRARGDQAVNPRLAELLESGELDFEDPRHREAYLKAWAAGAFSPVKAPAPRIAVRRGHG